MIKNITLVSMILASLGLTGCASIVSGTKQPVAVNTTPAGDADCVLKNDKGSWEVSHTPGSVVVHRSRKPLDVTCQEKGYKTAEVEVKSKTKKMAMGNVVFGGVVGVGVDVANGAAFQYPANIDVPMVSQSA